MQVHRLQNVLSLLGWASFLQSPLSTSILHSPLYKRCALHASSRPKVRKQDDRSSPFQAPLALGGIFRPSFVSQSPCSLPTQLAGALCKRAQRAERRAASIASEHWDRLQRFYRAYLLPRGRQRARSSGARSRISTCLACGEEPSSTRVPHI